MTPSGRGKRVAARAVEPYDVAVLGGGVAGAVAARLLAAWGHRTILLTRPAPTPALAESLPPSCEKLLVRAGLLGAVNAAEFIRFTGHTVRWGGGPERVETFGSGARGWQVPRDALDALLLREASASGAEVRSRARVRGVSLSTGRGPHQVTYDEGAKRREIAAKWILDCTGRAGPVAWRGTRAPQGAPRTMAIIGVWDRRGGWPLADESHTLVESYDGGWAWSVPLSRTRRQVTVMIDPARSVVAAGPKLPTTYRAELARTALCLGLTKGARLIGRPFARDASPYESTRLSAKRALLVGDAASFADPLSSFGVKKALASAWLAAVVARSAIADPAREAAAVALFELRERAMAAALRRDLLVLARDAAASHTEGFWSERGAASLNGDSADAELGIVRADPAVRRMHEALRTRPALAVRLATGAARVAHPLVEDDLIVVRNHFVFAGFPGPVRYLRNVDLIPLADLAPGHDDVPALYAAYRKSGGGGELPDVVSALAVLLAKGALRFS